MPKKVVHLMHNSHFTQGAITFINGNFHNKEHIFIVINGSNLVDIEDFYAKTDNVLRIKFFGKHIRNKPIKILVFLLQLPWFIMKIFPRLFYAKKIIIHSLFIPFLEIIFIPCFWLLKKSYWCIWGGDLYTYLVPKISLKDKIKERLKGFIIRNLFAVITHIKGDYLLAKDWYGFQGEYYSCFMYQSNLYKGSEFPQLEHKDAINIQVGNSATESNCHREIFIQLQKIDLTGIKLLIPLSYGDNFYKDSIIREGKMLFKDKFIPITDFMTLDEYNKWQNRIDIAIFNHNRQQGMGNITTLLGMGKKVYMNSQISSYQTLVDLGLTIFDIKDGITLQKLDPNLAKQNIEIIKNYFSEKQLKNDMKNIWMN